MSDLYNIGIRWFDIQILCSILLLQLPLLVRFPIVQQNILPKPTIYYITTSIIFLKHSDKKGFFFH